MDRMNDKKYDAIIIGGGHNGLVTAAYLAKAGKKVVVLERRHLVGGAAVTEEIYPGFKYTVASYVVSLLRPEVGRAAHPRPIPPAVGQALNCPEDTSILGVRSTSPWARRSTRLSRTGAGATMRE